VDEHHEEMVKDDVFMSQGRYCQK